MGSLGLARILRASGATAAMVALLGTRWAHAEPAVATSDDNSTPVYDVILRGTEPGAIWEIYPPEGPIDVRNAIARCGEDGCTLKLRAGRYRLWLGGTGRYPPRHSYDLDVTSDLDLTVRPPREGAKRAGLALAIVGQASYLAGLVIIQPYMPILGGQRVWNPKRVHAAEGLMAVGLIAIPIGWVTFAINRRLRVRPTLLSPLTETAPPRVELGVQGFGAGWGVGGRVTF